MNRFRTSSRSSAHSSMMKSPLRPSASAGRKIVRMEPAHANSGDYSSSRRSSFGSRAESLGEYSSPHRSSFSSRADSLTIGLRSHSQSQSGDHSHSRRRRKSTPVPASFMGDHFVTLGLSQTASVREIKSAYRQLAKKYHPDVCQGDQCQPQFIQINNAYEHALGMQYASSICEGEDYSEDCKEELEDWESWMGWEGAGTLDFAVDVSFKCSRTEQAEKGDYFSG